MKSKQKRTGKPSDRAAILGYESSTAASPAPLPSDPDARRKAIDKKVHDIRAKRIADANAAHHKAVARAQAAAEFVDPQTHVARFKQMNADETNEMEALAPLAQKLQKFHTMPGFPADPSWLFIAYGGYAIRIHKGPRLSSPCRLTLHTRHEGKNANLSEVIAECWTKEFIFTMPNRALEQYLRALCEDVL